MRTKDSIMAKRNYLYVRVSPLRKAKLKRHVARLAEKGDLPYRPDLRRCVTVAVAEWIDSLPD